MARIIVQTPSGEETLELQPGQTITIGRDQANRLPLPDAQGVSRRHCRVGPREGGEAGWEIADLGSTNGTRVGGQKVKSKVLVSGDEIEVGSARLTFEDPEEEARLEAFSKEGVCFLEWVTGGRKGEKLPLEAKRITIGRKEANGLVLDDRMVSGHHAEIDRDLNGYTIRDLGSTNGTVVNGEPISEALLTHGSRVRIGNARFVFKDPSMKDVEVALDHFEEDEGWGMMGEIDLARGGGSRGGLLLVLLLFAAAAAGGWWLSQQETETATAGRGSAVGLVENGDFETDDVLWSAEREEGVRVQRSARGGNPGAWLKVSNTGEADEGPALVTYEQLFETAGARPMRFEAAVRRQGEDGAAFVVIWASDPTAEELAAGVTSLERSDILAEAGSGWRPLDEVLVPPQWARTARIGVHVPPGAGVGIDSVDVTWEPLSGSRPTLAVPKFKTAYPDHRATVDLLANRTILLTGARPGIELPDGTWLTTFRSEGEPAVSDTGIEVRGAFVGPEGDIPAVVRWSQTDEGLRMDVSADGAASVGLTALAPSGNLGGGVNVLGDFMPQTLPIGESTSLENVARTLVGRPPATGVGLSTLLAFEPVTETPTATLTFGRARDAGLIEFTHRVPGSEGAVRVITDFSGQKRQAQDDLAAAKALASSRPGEAIRAFRDVALAYPFEKEVRDEALRLASDLEEEARKNVAALDKAVRDFEVYRSADALVAMESIASRLEAQFLGENSQEGSLESEVAKLVQRVGEGRAGFEVEMALPDLDRLERLYTLLASEEGYGPMAAVYARAVVDRYEHLAAEAPDIARRVQAAQERLAELKAQAAVQKALPPAPEEP